MFESREEHLPAFTDRRETLYLAGYATLLALAPIVLSHQLLAGIVVNALLIRACLHHPLKSTFFLAFLPSRAVLATGFLFGGLTSYILLMAPFIWIGNLAIMALTRKLFVQRKKNYFLSTFAASAAKTALLFCSALALYSFSLVPFALLSAFGLMQLATAEGGAIIVWFMRSSFGKKASAKPKLKSKL